MSGLMERIMAAQPQHLVQAALARINQGAAALDAALRNKKSTRFLRAPKATLESLMGWAETTSTALSTLGELTLPRDLREQLAVLIEAEGPMLLQEFLRNLRERIAELEQDHSSLPFFGYFLRAERKYPYATLFAVADLLRRVELTPSFANVLPQLEAPSFDPEAESEHFA